MTGEHRPSRATGLNQKPLLLIHKHVILFLIILYIIHRAIHVFKFLYKNQIINLKMNVKRRIWKICSFNFSYITAANVRWKIAEMQVSSGKKSNNVQYFCSKLLLIDKRYRQSYR